MKIESGIKSLTTGNIPDDKTRPAAKKPAGEAAEPQSGTNVQLSSVASQLQAMQKGFADTPIVDAARVAELKLAISEGRFQVNADKVVASLVKTVEDLIRAHRA
jgi:negative regulator of flagellin synthesis FlgM